jgi:short-subunit dehydrogenase
VGGTTWRDAGVLVTGASRGIGRAVAEEAGRRGARLALVARSEGELAELARRLGNGAHPVAADLSDPARARAVVEQAERLLGGVDVLVANAGAGAYGPFVELDPTRIDELVALNVLGTLHLVRAVLPGMVARRRGRVVLVGSIAGRVGAPLEALYSATKFAQAGFAEALEVELAPLGVGVTLVDPGPVATSFFEARGHPYARRRPRPLPPERVAKALADAVERGRFEVTVPPSLGLAAALRRLAPGPSRAATRLAFRRELARALAGRGR